MTILDNPDPTAVRPRAVLVGVQLPGTTEEELHSSLDELERLATTLGLDPVARVTQARSGTTAGAVLGEGKLRELAALTGGTGVVPSGASRRQTGARPAEEAEPAAVVAAGEAGVAGGDSDDEGGGDAGADDGATDQAVAGGEPCAVVVFDHDLTPSQLRNLEGATDAEVLDRSSLILGIFQRHARTREARLQVEAARLKYLAPRMRVTGRSGDRQRGGVGGRGSGESSLELDRRKVRDRIAEISQQLEIVRREEGARRARRERADTVALVGYTNAGKSSLMRALTGREVLVADKLFATLGTTVRVLQPETRPRILVSDTVGFIKKLPHDLVASFRSTLEEARDAALLVHVVDASDAAWRSQLELTRSVLADIGADDAPSLLYLNKADRLSSDVKAGLAEELPEAVQGSTFRPEDVAALRARIVAFFEAAMESGELFVPYRSQHLVHEVFESCRVLSETHGDAGTVLQVRAPREVLERLRARVGAAAVS